jgi:hypothetical protein
MNKEQATQVIANALYTFETGVATREKLRNSPNTTATQLNEVNQLIDQTRRILFEAVAELATGVDCNKIADLSPPTSLEPIDHESGDLFTIAEFVEMCKHSSFIDYDGMGNWATETMREKGSWDNPKWIYPSQIVDGLQPPTWATHVLWYNR